MAPSKHLLQTPAGPEIKQPSAIFTHVLFNRRRKVGLQVRQVSLRPKNWQFYTVEEGIHCPICESSWPSTQALQTEELVIHISHVYEQTKFFWASVIRAMAKIIMEIFILWILILVLYLINIFITNIMIFLIHNILLAWFRNK